MPRHIDVRIRIPVKYLGNFVDEILPEYAEVIGFDKLAEHDGAYRPNGVKRHYGPRAAKGGVPEKGTEAAKLYDRIKRYPGKTRGEHFAVLLKAGSKLRAISSALYHMRDRGLIVQDAEGGWKVGNQGGDE